MKNAKQAGWVILEWDIDIENSHDLIHLLPPEAKGVENDEHWEDLLRDGLDPEDRSCEHDLKKLFPVGIAVEIKSLLKSFWNNK